MLLKIRFRTRFHFVNEEQFRTKHRESKREMANKSAIGTGRMKKKFQWTMLISFRPKPVVTFLRFDYSIASSFLFLSAPVLKFAIFRLKVLPFTANRWEDFHNFRYIFFASCVLPCLDLSCLLLFIFLFYDHIIAFSLMVFRPYTYNTFISRYVTGEIHHWIPTVPIFFSFSWNDPNGKPLMEFKWNYITHLCSHSHSHSNDVSQTKNVQQKKTKEKTVNSQFHFVWVPVNP